MVKRPHMKSDEPIWPILKRLAGYYGKEPLDLELWGLTEGLKERIELESIFDTIQRPQDILIQFYHQAESGSEQARLRFLLLFAYLCNFPVENNTDTFDQRNTNSFLRSILCLYVYCLLHDLRRVSVPHKDQFWYKVIKQSCLPIGVSQGEYAMEIFVDSKLGDVIKVGQLRKIYFSHVEKTMVLTSVDFQQLRVWFLQPGTSSEATMEKISEFSSLSWGRLRFRQVEIERWLNNVPFTIENLNGLYRLADSDCTMREVALLWYYELEGFEQQKMVRFLFGLYLNFSSIPQLRIEVAFRPILTYLLACLHCLVQEAYRENFRVSPHEYPWNTFLQHNWRRIPGVDGDDLIRYLPALELYCSRKRDGEKVREVVARVVQEYQVPDHVLRDWFLEP